MSEEEKKAEAFSTIHTGEGVDKRVIEIFPEKTGYIFVVNDDNGCPLAEFSLPDGDLVAFAEEVDAAVEAWRALQCLGETVCPICYSPDIQTMMWVDRGGKPVDECGTGIYCPECDRKERDTSAAPQGTLGYTKGLHVDSLAREADYIERRRVLLEKEKNA